MATKTISIDMEAYRKLTRARLSPKDFFSQVIRRARWDEQVKTCGGILAAVPNMPVTDEAVLARLKAAQGTDSAPGDKRSRLV